MRSHHSGVWRPSVPPEGPSFSYRARGFPFTEQNCSPPALDRSLPLGDHRLNGWTWGLRCRPESSRGEQGQNGRGLSGPLFSEGKAWSCWTCVPALVTHVTSHLDLDLMRPGSRPSGHPTQQFSKMAAALKDGFAAAACVCVVVTSCHVVLCSRQTTEAGPGWAGFRGSFLEDWHVHFSLNRPGS